MYKKYSLLLLLLLIPVTVFAIPVGVSWDEFCDIKTNNHRITAADFICELDIFEMDDRIEYLESLIPIPILNIDISDSNQDTKYITIEGFVPLDYELPLVNMQIISTDGESIIFSENVSNDFIFRTILQGDFWGEGGFYTVRVIYSDDRVLTNNFEFIYLQKTINHDIFEIVGINDINQVELNINSIESTTYLPLTIISNNDLIISDVVHPFIFWNNDNVHKGNPITLSPPGNYTLTVSYGDYYDEYIFELE